MISLLLFLSICFGLVEPYGFSIRTASIIALFLICSYRLKGSYFYYVNVVFVLMFIIFYTQLYSEGVVEFSNTFLLHVRNLVVFIVLYGVIFKSNIDFKTLLAGVSLFIVVCALINISIIAFFEKPWVIISLYTGSEEDNFGHLYNRLILPFGTPNQLGFVSGLLLIYNFAVGNRAMVLLLLIPLIGSASNSSLIPLTLIICFALFVKILKFRNAKITKRSLTIIALLGVFSLLSLIFYFYGILPDSLWGRSSENVAESMSRHLMLRLNTLSSLSDFSFQEFFYGVGFGNSYQYIGGTYSFTIPLTILFEAGLLGLYVYYLLPTLLFLTFTKTPFSIFVVSYFILASLLYQLNNDVSFYLLPLIILYQLKRNENENNISI